LKIFSKSSNARFEDEKKELITIINESLGDGFSLNKTKKVYETTASIDLVKYLGGYGRKEFPKGYKDLDDLMQKAEQEKEDINKPDIEDNSFTFVGSTEKEYSMRVRIDYTSGDNVFQTKDFVIINL